jgi:hypothetical protein
MLGSSSETRAGRRYIDLSSKNVRLLEPTIKSLALIADYSREFTRGNGHAIYIFNQSFWIVVEFATKLIGSKITRREKL